MFGQDCAVVKWCLVEIYHWTKYDDWMQTSITAASKGAHLWSSWKKVCSLHWITKSSNEHFHFCLSTNLVTLSLHMQHSEPSWISEGPSNCTYQEGPDLWKSKWYCYCHHQVRQGLVPWISAICHWETSDWEELEWWFKHRGSRGCE